MGSGTDDTSTTTDATSSLLPLMLLLALGGPMSLKCAWHASDREMLASLIESEAPARCSDN